MNIKNNTTVIGKIGEDSIIIPPTKEKANQIVTFDLITTNNYTDSSTGERKTKNTWYEVVIFFPKKKPITITNYLKKGKLVGVCGEVSAHAYMDKETKQPKAKLKLTVAPGEVKLL